MTDTQTPDPAAAIAENATLRASITSLQADNARLLTESQAAARDRDAFKNTIAELEPQAKRAAELEIKVTGYQNAAREGALVEGLRGKLPGADPLTIAGVVAKLHEQGKINRYPEDAAAELAKALPIITAEAPGLARPPTGASGSSLVRPTGAGTYKGPFSQ